MEFGVGNLSSLLPNPHADFLIFLLTSSSLPLAVSSRGSEGVLLQVRGGEGVYGDARSGYQALEVRELLLLCRARS